MNIECIKYSVLFGCCSVRIFCSQIKEGEMSVTGEVLDIARYETVYSTLNLLVEAGEISRTRIKLLINR